MLWNQRRPVSETEQATQTLKAAHDLERAAAHLRVAAAHLQAAEVPRYAAQLAGRGHLLRAHTVLDGLAVARAAHSHLLTDEGY
ncbi:hypothetical protein [Deinococcus multiflagellatus]|uniref:Uncharacterized protein n=1 Tax=Deinococcus multiflagellatus TaxID=1656887 RepID=A0ABW1ZMN1_9DEIO|nr:hypothetical protein [Deinococcus multiflagellatus]MBZ9714216.1 hypothetical protein [Deinococcus multiflagellatus]